MNDPNLSTLNNVLERKAHLEQQIQVFSREKINIQKNIDTLNRKLLQTRKQLMQLCDHKWELDTHYEPCGPMWRTCKKCGNFR